MLLQLDAQQRTPIAGKVGQFDPSVLDLRAQRDGVFRLRLTPLPQDRAPLLAQRVDPCPPTGALCIAIEPPRDHQKPGFPRTQHVSPRDSRIGELFLDGGDQVVQVWLAQLRCGGRANPGHPGVAGRARGQPVAVTGKHVTPAAVHVDLGHHSYHRIGVLRGGVQQHAIGFGQRGCRGNNEHHRHRRIAGSQLCRLDEPTLRQPFGQCRAHTANPGQPRTGHQHHLAAVDDRQTQPGKPRRDRCHQLVHPGRVITSRADHDDFRYRCRGMPPASDHSRRDPRAISAPHVRCMSPLSRL
ncbi:hypothetical protein FF22_00882 [Mycobacterium tuberculosis]|nr:hypothetical protein FF22_00882 [Mycobacterium tuberculosis]